MTKPAPESASGDIEFPKLKSHTDLLVPEERQRQLIANMEDKERHEAEKSMLYLQNIVLMSASVPTVDSHGKVDMEPTYQHQKHVLSHRRDTANRLLMQVDKERSALPTKKANAIIDLGTENQKSIKDLTDIEEEIEKAISEEKTKLYFKNDPNMPHFGEIYLMEQTLASLKTQISQKASPEVQAMTLSRIQMVEHQLALIKSRDPSGYMRARWEIPLRNKEKQSAPYKAGKMLLLGGAGLMFTLSAITTGKKIAGGEDLEFTDALTLGYGLATMKLAGVDMSKKTELKEATRLAQNLAKTEGFASLMERMGPVTTGDAFDEACTLLNDDNDKRKELEKILEQNSSKRSLTKELLFKFLGEDDKNKLYIALAKDNVSDRDRHMFMSKALELRKDVDKLRVIVEETRP